MIKLSLTFAFLFAGLFCFGQTTYKLDKDTSGFKNRPLYVLKLPQQAPIPTAALIIDVNDIDSISVKKDSESLKLYGKKARSGSIEIHLRDRASIVGYQQLLTDFNIPYANRDLPVFIDSAIAYQPKNTYFEISAVKSVKIAEEKATGMKYIIIISLYPLNRQKKSADKKGKNTNIKIAQ